VTGAFAASGLVAAATPAFALGAPALLVFSTQPAGAAAGTALTAQPVVTIEDAQGNVETTDNSGVALAITAGSGISGATLSGCSSTTVAGVATFSGCQVNDPGAGYTLTATDANDGGLDAVSNVFNVADAPPSFPDADVSYPNGAIVNFGGTDYVFAGGRAFGVPSASVLASVQEVDHAVIVSAPAGATAPTATTPRAGTLLFTSPVNANPTIYVVGTDGELHGFSTPAQYVGDGYDTALVVTVPSLGGLTVGSTVGAEGAAVTALATSADGAIVDSSGTFYVFAGGEAFGPLTSARLTELQEIDKAKVLSGSVGPAQTSAGVANGVLFSDLGPSGTATVSVSYGGSVFPFTSLAQLASDGYSGTAAVPTGTGNLTVVFPYSGS
jgi:hypothetical protein